MNLNLRCGSLLFLVVAVSACDLVSRPKPSPVGANSVPGQRSPAQREAVDRIYRVFGKIEFGKSGPKRVPCWNETIGNLRTEYATVRKRFF